jgi:hypothetical protein
MIFFDDKQLPNQNFGISEMKLYLKAKDLL